MKAKAEITISLISRRAKQKKLEFLDDYRLCLVAVIFMEELTTITLMLGQVKIQIASKNSETLQT